MSGKSNEEALSACLEELKATMETQKIALECYQHCFAKESGEVVLSFLEKGKEIRMPLASVLQTHLFIECGVELHKIQSILSNLADHGVDKMSGMFRKGMAVVLNLQTHISSCGTSAASKQLGGMIEFGLSYLKDIGPTIAAHVWKTYTAEFEELRKLASHEDVVVEELLSVEEELPIEKIDVIKRKWRSETAKKLLKGEGNMLAMIASVLCMKAIDMEGGDCFSTVAGKVEKHSEEHWSDISLPIALLGVAQACYRVLKPDESRAQIVTDCQENIQEQESGVQLPPKVLALCDRLKK